MSQPGSKYRFLNCGLNTWQAITNYWYTGVIKDSTTPPPPDTSYNTIPGSGVGVRLNFPSHVRDGTRDFNVGWTYKLYFKINGSWQLLKKTQFQGGPNGYIPTSYEYVTNSCRSYRVVAINPSGASDVASFRQNDACIQPG
jgi:hypothetical protein